MDAREIYSLFQKYKKIFPHIRQDYIERMIAKGCVIFEDDVILIIQQYQKSVCLGDYKIPKDDWIIHQILNVHKGNGNAHEILKKWTDTLQKDVWLTVRTNNVDAINFYEKNGFEKVGKIWWKNNTIEGEIMKKRLLFAKLQFLISNI